MDRSGTSTKSLNIEAFIAAVKEREALYNTRHVNYPKKKIRLKLWNEIAQLMFPEWPQLDAKGKNERGFLLQKKWKSLKDCFNRELRLQEFADPTKSRKKYELYDKLTFLLVNSTGQKRLKTNLSIADIDRPPRSELESRTTGLAPRSELESRPTGLAPRSELESRPIGLAPRSELESRPIGLAPRSELESRPIGLAPRPELESRPTRLAPRPELESRPTWLAPQIEQARKDDICRKSEDDSDKLFLMSFVDDMKRLPLPTKYWVKMKFSEIMHQAAMSLEEYQTCSASGEVFELDRGNSAQSFVAESVKILPSSPSNIYTQKDN